MKYWVLKEIYRKSRLSNGADGSGVDSSVDKVVIRDPNQYLAPIIGKFTIIEVLFIVATVLSIWVSILAIQKSSK
jgi:hypothetical protein